MTSMPIVKLGLVFVTATLLFTQDHAIAATGSAKCSGDDLGTANGAARNIQLIDYSAPGAAAASSEILKEPDALESSPITLTTETDTSLRRDDHVKADLELPAVDGELVHAPDAAAILLERRSGMRNDESHESVTRDTPDMTTELPGMDSDEMLKFRQQMYRTDI